MGARESVENGAIVIIVTEQATQQQTDHLSVPHHVTAILERLGLGRIEERADDDRWARQTAGPGNERGVGAFAGARSTTEENDLFGKPQVFPPKFFLQALPNGTKDQLSVLDFEVSQLGSCRGRGLKWESGRRHDV